jgi:ABC-2 type transport system ATP-binding protein
MTLMVAALEFQQTTKRYGAYTALDSLTLSVGPAEILGFLGPNGAGKTTAIYLALGFLHASSGGGRLLDKPFGNAAARKSVGFVPDAPNFFASSAKDAVTFAGKLNGMRNPRLRERTKELLARLDLSNTKKDVRKFSRGMQQRLGIAQALVNDPDLIILDEPTSALDPGGVLEVRELLQTASREGKSIFFSSHQLSEVERICDRIAFLDRGRLLRCGSLEALTGNSEQVEIVFRNLLTDILPQYRILNREASTDTRFLAPNSEQRRIIEAGWIAGGTLVSVTPVRKSLEQLFMEWSREDRSE